MLIRSLVTFLVVVGRVVVLWLALALRLKPIRLRLSIGCRCTNEKHLPLLTLADWTVIYHFSERHLILEVISRIDSIRYGWKSEDGFLPL